MKKSNILSIFMAFIIFIPLNLFAQNSGFKKEPYMLLKENSILILWQLYAQETCTFSYIKSTNGTLEVETLAGPFDDHLYSIELSGLVEGAKYDFEVGFDVNPISGSFYFHPPTTDEEVSFFSYGDTQANPEINNLLCSQMITEMGGNNETIFVHAGDWNTDDFEEDWQTNFFHSNTDQYSKLFRSQVPIMGTLGNHDDYGIVYKKYWPYDYPSIQNPVDFDVFHSFDYGPIHFSMVSLRNEEASMSSNQKAWLEADLNASNQPWKVLVFHCSIHDFSTKHIANTLEQQYLQDLCETHTIQLVINGHNHYYSHWMKNNVHHLVLGGGGANNYSINPGNGEIKEILMHHFAKMSVDSKRMNIVIKDEYGIQHDEFYIPQNYKVCNNENIIWEDGLYYADEITVCSGSSLRIKGEVRFSEQGKVIVEPGGELFIDGGHFTSIFDEDLWQGIIVEGQANLTQSQSNQGSLRLMNGAVIENALYGVQLYKRQSDGEPIPTTGGGILIADGATFKNNKVAIAAGYYNYSSNSAVLNSDFIIDEDYYSMLLVEPKFAHLHLINQFSFSGNTFKYDVATTLAPTIITPIGIKSYNSKISVNNNTFENLQYGVHSTELNYTLVSEISNNTFTKNLTGIYMSGANSPQITFNSFEIKPYHIGIPFSQVFTGVYIDGSYNHSVEENNFTSDASTTSSKQQRKTGLLINNGGTQDVEVYKNTFDHLMYAVLAQNENKHSTGDGGLCFKCNDFNDNYADITVTYEGLEQATTGVARHQGSPALLSTAPAGNLFSSLSSGVSWHINNIDGISKKIFYYHHSSIYGTDLVPSPSKCNNVENVPSIAPYLNACPTHYTGGGIGGDKSAAGARLDDAQENELIATASLESLTDDGDTPALQAEIATATSDEAMEVRTELLEVAPYTSEEVLIEATQKEDVLNNALIRDVLVANPQAAKSEEVMMAIEDRTTAMPQYMKDQINEGLATVSAKEELEATAFYNRTSYTNALSDMVFFLLSDTLGNPMDSVILLLEQSHYLYAKYQLADIYLNQKNASALNLVLENISNNFNLEDEFLIEYEQLLEYYELILAVYNEDRTIFELSATEKATLSSYYENSNNLAAINARNILNEIGEIEYTEPYVFPEEEMKSSYVTIADPKTSFDATLHEEMQIYPNPANDYLICEYEMSKGFNSCSLSIIKSGSGKSLYTQVLKHQQDAITIDLKGFTTGQYILILRTDGQVSHQTKFNIVK